jgi:hypothetical protein
VSVYTLTVVLAVGLFLFDFQNVLGWWGGRVLGPHFERDFDFTIVVPVYGHPRYFENRHHLRPYQANVLVAIDVGKPRRYARCWSGGPMRPPRRARPEARKARAYASDTFSPPAITSPVDRISGPRVAAEGKRSLGKTASLAKARAGAARSGRSSAASGSPSKSRQAWSTSGTPSAFETNGTVRDARGFASST